MSHCVWEMRALETASRGGAVQLRESMVSSKMCGWAHNQRIHTIQSDWTVKALRISPSAQSGPCCAGGGGSLSLLLGEAGLPSLDPGLPSLDSSLLPLLGVESALSTAILARR